MSEKIVDKVARFLAWSKQNILGILSEMSCEWFQMWQLAPLILQKEFSWGLGCPQQAKQDAEGGEAVIRISEKDILIHCLQFLYRNLYLSY